MPSSQETYRRKKWEFYRYKSKRPLKERLALRSKWWKLWQEARAKNVSGTSQKAIDMIKAFEGFSPYAYDDGVGVSTIGYGTTSADVSPLPKRVSFEEGEKILKKALKEKYEPDVKAAEARYGIKFSQAEFDALVSFVYNLGPGAVGTAKGFSTLQGALASKNRPAIANALLLYTNPGTSVHAGLLRRRKAEKELFLNGKYPAK